ncbi:hypothetical protein Aperf_G00000037166 [Anoplocephala perfoliata]
MLDHWLSNPFVESFYCPPDFLDLKRLLFLVSQWSRVFASNSQPARRNNSMSKDAARCRQFMKARDSVRPMSQSCQLSLAQMMEDVCLKITTVSDCFHVKAGLFKEVNCDKDTTDTNAEQLTFHDAELFIKVIPSECLNYVRHRSAKSVDATIKQFNRIYGLVLTTIIEADHMKSSPSYDVADASLASLTLSAINVPLQQDYQRHANFDGRHSALARLPSSLSPGQDLDSLQPCSCKESSFLRAKILAKWISVAAELRALRSFSAFTSVMTALQGSAVSGLHATWGIVERYYPDKSEAFHELSELLKLDDNRKYARELLDHVYSSYELARHQESRHNGLLSSLFGRRIGSDSSVQAENILNTVGTIPYLGIFLNDLAMLNESAPDRVPRPKPSEFRRPASGTGLIYMKENHRKTSDRSENSTGKQNSYVKISTDFHEKRQRSHLSQEPVSTPPIVMCEAPKPPPRRKRLNDSTDSGTESATNETRTRKPPVPLVADHRSRKETMTNESPSSTTPTSSGVVLPEDKRSRQAKGPHGPPLPVEPLSAIKTSIPPVTQFQKVPRPRRRHSMSSSIAASTVAAATMVLDNDDLINFRKHAREYKILSKLMQLQATATRYKIQEDTAFRQWFENLALLSEDEAHGERQISGSVEVLALASGSDEFPRSRLSSPTHLTPSHSATGSNCYGRSSFNMHDSRKTPIKESPKQDAKMLRRHSNSFGELRWVSERFSHSRTHQQLETFKKKIKTTLSHTRSDSSHSLITPVTQEEECSTRF